MSERASGWGAPFAPIVRATGRGWPDQIRALASPVKSEETPPSRLCVAIWKDGRSRETKAPPLQWKIIALPKGVGGSLI